MDSKLGIVPEGHNKSVYYLLPLMGFNKFSFGGEQNFINSYVSYNGRVVVLIKDKNLLNEYWNDPHYQTDFDVEYKKGEYGTMLVYEIHSSFHADLERFLNGKYSSFSEEAKNTIKKKSTLAYKHKVSGQEVTHKMLLVLDKSAVLRGFIENNLGIALDDSAELLEKPSYELEYTDIDTIII